ncbi:MAG: hypothetical protein EBU90_25055 [Proteobacteria bacterium]|nr:hypothetical protein [Pseudomonadota bacterium]
MSEEKVNPDEKSKIYEIEIIPHDAMIKTQISGFVYARLNSYITNFFQIPKGIDPKKFTMEALDPYKTDKSEEQFHFETIMGIILGLEEEAREQKLIKVVKYDTEKQQVIPEENQPDPQASSDTQLPDSTPPSSSPQTT